eukprot:11630778-Prorocentrum_lima.AAC.1
MGHSLDVLFQEGQSLHKPIHVDTAPSMLFSSDDSWKDEVDNAQVQVLKRNCCQGLDTVVVA